jgi:hypothetical protein
MLHVSVIVTILGHFILSFKIMDIRPEDSQCEWNMQHVLTRLTKFVVVEGSTHVSFNVYLTFVCMKMCQPLKVQNEATQI